MNGIDSTHWLSGDAVFRRATPNHGGAITPKFLVFHYTACSNEAAIATFLKADASNRTSAHLIVDRDGRITQMVPFNLRAWHAGASEWAGFTDLNTHSIGIEVVNPGYLHRFADGSYRPKEGGAAIAASDVVKARHKNPSATARYWHAYTPDQIERCKTLATMLTQHYSLRDVVGHDDIAPTRKVDPGPAFPLAAIRAAAIGRDDQQANHALFEVVADKLNVRSGPGTHYGRVREPLAKGSRVRLLRQDTPGWTLIQPIEAAWGAGWVSSAYLRPAV